MCFRQAGGTVTILLRKLRISGLCCYAESHPVEMGHNAEPKFFSENNFESVQNTGTVTEIPKVCTVNHERGNCDLERIWDECPSLASL